MPRFRRGFTLVELLVVIAIIGILMALLFPAVNAIREAGRQATCSNNLSQIAKACDAFRSTWRALPSGGWGPRWAGDPTRGAGINQPGGWIYNLLPNVGYQELHDKGKEEQTDAKRRAAGATICERSLPLFLCPSRARPESIPYAASTPYNNIDQPSLIAFSDYAANAEDLLPGTGDGPKTVDEAKKMTEDQWLRLATNTPDPLQPGRNKAPTGVIYLRSMVSAVPDGEGCTYLVGEKYVNNLKYETADDLGWDTGFGPDLNRWTYYDANSGKNTRPILDNAKDHNQSFGSYHANGVIMAYCDAHTAVVNYDIDYEIHRQLGNRADGISTDVTKAD